MLRLFPSPGGSLPAESVYDDLRWPVPDGPRPYVAINMIATADGRAAVAGRATGIGTATDRLVLRKLRCAADAVLIGAGTLRAEEYVPTVPARYVSLRQARGLAPQPLGVLLSGSGHLPCERRFFQRDDFPRLLLTGASGAAKLDASKDPDLRGVVVGEATVDLAAALAVLRLEHGVRWLLCEGGPRVVHALLAARLVDELFLTVAPKLVGNAGPTIVDGAAFPPDAPVTLHLLAIHADGDELYLRYRVCFPSGSAFSLPAIQGG